MDANVYILTVEDGEGDLVDILRYCRSCGPLIDGAGAWPAHESLDYPEYCQRCEVRLAIPLTEHGEAYCRENGIPLEEF